MAEAKAVEERKVTGIDLHLSLDEAEALHALLYDGIAGPDEGPRKALGDIRSAVCMALGDSVEHRWLDMEPDRNYLLIRGWAN